MPTLTPKQLDTLAAISVFGVTRDGRRLDVGFNCMAYSDDPDLADFQASLQMSFMFQKMGGEAVPVTRSIRDLNDRTMAALKEKGVIAFNRRAGYQVTDEGARVMESPKAQAAVEKYRHHRLLREAHGWGVEDLHYGWMSRCRCGWKKPFGRKDALFDAYFAWEAHFEDLVAK